jgi:hypothetical protein
LTPLNEQLKTLKTEIKNFVCGSLNVSKENFTANIESGGLGFPDLDEFIYALQCGWIKKCIGNTIENWRFDLNLTTNYNPVTFSQFDSWSGDQQLALGLSVSYETFKVCYYLINDNFLVSEFFGNPLLQTQNNLRWDTGQIPPPNDNNWQQRKKILMSDKFTDTGTVKSREELSVVFSCNLPVDTYQSLKRAIELSKQKANKKKFWHLNSVPLTLKIF